MIDPQKVISFNLHLKSNLLSEKCNSQLKKKKNKALLLLYVPKEICTDRLNKQSHTLQYKPQNPFS